LGGEKVRELFVKELMNILEQFYYSKDKIELERYSISLAW
jgi:hypothetical protein